MIYDIIIIWWWASGLFCALNAPKNSSKLILEKQWNLWTKILMSGWWRCNFSNTQVSPEKYFGKNKKMLPSVLHKFNNNEMVDFLESNWIKTQQEDNGRLILKSWKAQELLDLLVKKTKENQTEIKLNQNIINIKKKWNIFTLNTQIEEFQCHKLIISTGGISFPHLWTDWFWLDLATQFNLKTIQPYPALSGVETNENLTKLSGSSILSNLEVFHNNKLIYQQSWNVLFTHKWLSGPSIFNATTAIGEYLNNKGKYNIQQIQNNISLKITIQEKYITKRLRQSELLSSNMSSWAKSKDLVEITFNIKKISPIEIAKVSWWWISMNEIKPSFESKKISDLYFIWETLDITGQTWWFNLQRAWSSGFVCWKNL